MKTNLLSALVACLATVLSTFAQPYGTAGEITKVTKDETFMLYPYVEYLPDGYDGVKKFPLIIVLGGAGEGGDGSSSSLQTLINKTDVLELVQNNVRTYDGIVVIPQAQNSNGTFKVTDLKIMFDAVTSAYPVDLDRVYMTGFSFGGQFLWQFADQYPNHAAAIVPICGAGTVRNPPSVEMLTLPCWSFHAFNDGIPFTKTRDNFMRVSRSGLNPTAKNSSGIYPYGTNGSAADQDYTFQMDVNISSTDTSVGMSLSTGIAEPTNYHAFTLFKTGGHVIWDDVYANDDVWDWLFRQSRNGEIVTSLDKAIAKDIKIYPNPSQNKKVTIDFGTSSFANQTVSVEVLNELGQVIYTEQTSGNTTLNKFTSAGVYTIKITSATDSITKNVVIK